MMQTSGYRLATSCSNKHQQHIKSWCIAVIWKKHIESALNGRNAGLGHYVELFLSAVILYSTIVMGLVTLPGLPEWLREFFFATDILIVAIFTIEYIARIIVAPKKWSYIFSFYGIIDFLSVAPFYLALIFIGLGLDLRALRALRLLRLARLFKLARYTQAMDRLTAAWRAVKQEIIAFSITAVIVLYICALVIYQFEHDAQPQVFTSVLDAMWWAAVTLTTVGYGDIYPVTAIGRLLTVVMLFVALGIIAIPTGLVTSAMIAIRNSGHQDGHPDGENADATRTLSEQTSASDRSEFAQPKGDGASPDM